MDAVVRIGGKQYRMHEGSVLNVATIDAEPGSQVVLREVLLVSDDGAVTIGAPNIDDAVVVADVVEHGKGKKVVNFKYKAKVRYRRKRGHRQGYTTLEVREIRVGGKSVTAAARSRTRVAPAEDEPVAEAPAEPVAEATETATTEAPAATPRRRTRAAPKADAPPAEAGGEAPAPRRRRRTSSSETESQD